MRYNLIVSTGEIRTFKNKNLAEKEMKKLKQDGYGVKIYQENKLPKDYLKNLKKH